MDASLKYRQIIQAVMRRHAEHAPSHGQIETIPVCDEAGDNYLLLDAGWDRTGRVHDIVLHLRIRDQKILVEWDGTESGIAQELVNDGVRQDDIVCAFYQPESRAA